MITADAERADRDRFEDAAEADQPEQQRAVDRVAAERVAELVREHEPQLLLVEEVDQRGVDHDDRLVHADASSRW